MLKQKLLDARLLQLIVPGSAALRNEGVGENSPVDTVYWMQEAEIKNGRTAMLAGQPRRSQKI